MLSCNFQEVEVVGTRHVLASKFKSRNHAGTLVSHCKLSKIKERTTVTVIIVGNVTYLMLVLEQSDNEQKCRNHTMCNCFIRLYLSAMTLAPAQAC